jgi:hypothetical protein
MAAVAALSAIVSSLLFVREGIDERVPDFGRREALVSFAPSKGESAGAIDAGEVGTGCSKQRTMEGMWDRDGFVGKREWRREVRVKLSRGRPVFLGEGAEQQWRRGVSD